MNHLVTKKRYGNGGSGSKMKNDDDMHITKFKNKDGKITLKDNDDIKTATKKKKKISATTRFDKV